MTGKNKNEIHLLNAIQNLTFTIVFLLFVIAALIYAAIAGLPDFCSKTTQPVENIQKKNPTNDQRITAALWKAPDTSTIPNTKEGAAIRYGRNLVSNTSYYFGPNGKIGKAYSNGMNCQNCHLDAGTRPFGNNYGSAASTYPKWRKRSGSVESVSTRVNDCFQRSLNGKAIDPVGKEMNSIISYINWLGKDVKKGRISNGSGLIDLAFMDRAADPEKGKIIYSRKCSSCHSENGEGRLNENKAAYQYPPLWGMHSYNIGAGLFRVSRFAGYVKANMPYGTATYTNPQISDQEAWDVAAFVNSQMRPGMDLKKDWPNISDKPVDYPFGPYADGYSEIQHKYGPFGTIAEFKK